MGNLSKFLKQKSAWRIAAWIFCLLGAITLIFIFVYKDEVTVFKNMLVWMTIAFWGTGAICWAKTPQ